MKKFFGFLIVLSLLLFAAAVGAPYVIGFVVKQQFNSLIVSLNEADQLRAKVVNYHQGWLTSTATVEYSAQIPSNHMAANSLEVPVLKFNVNEKIHHGPIIFSPNPETPTIPFQFALALIETQMADPDLHFTGKTVLHLNGNTTTTLESDKIASHAENALGVSFILQGLHAKFDVSAKYNHSSGQVSLNALDIANGNRRQRVTDVGFNFNLTKDNSEIWVGDRNLNIAKIDLETNKNQKITANNAQMKFYNSVKNNRMRTGIAAKVKGVRVDNNNYGPQGISFSVSNIDVDTLSLLTKQLQQIKTAPQYRMFVFGTVYTQLLNLYSKGINFHLDYLSLNTSWGEVIGEIEVNLPPQSAPAPTINQLVSHLTANGNFNFPMSLAEEVVTAQLIEENSTASDPRTAARLAAKDKLKTWVAAGWLIPDGKNYKVEIAFEQNQLLINGKPFQGPTMTVNPVLPAPVPVQAPAQTTQPVNPKIQ